MGRGGVGVRGARSRASCLLTVALTSTASAQTPRMPPRAGRCRGRDPPDGASPAAGGGDRGGDGEEGERDGPATSYQRSPARQRPIRPSSSRRPARPRTRPVTVSAASIGPAARELGGCRGRRGWSGRCARAGSDREQRGPAPAPRHRQAGGGPSGDVEGSDRQTQQRPRTPPGRPGAWHPRGSAHALRPAAACRWRWSPSSPKMSVSPEIPRR